MPGRLTDEERFHRLLKEIIPIARRLADKHRRAADKAGEEIIAAQAARIRELEKAAQP